MLIIFAVPYLIWRLGRMEYFAPLVVVQILTGILLGPGVLGSVLPDYYRLVFTPEVIQSLNSLSWWAVMLFVWIAGIELDLHQAWHHRRETFVTAGLALGVPLLLGFGAGLLLLVRDGWIGPAAREWQFLLGIGMACAVTALPILILLMEKLEILRLPLGQRILRYASVDDIAVWGVLALILLDLERVGRQITFLAAFAIAAWGFRASSRAWASTTAGTSECSGLPQWRSAPTGRGCTSWSGPFSPVAQWTRTGSTRSKWTSSAITCCW
jgi:Kef-type K+ transport system membrane component KefB